jgi:phosphoribosylaminoimidazole (AIR) synthetase
MYQIFNMGIGMAAIVSPADAKDVARMLAAKVIGEIVRGTGKTILSS